jgi:hypothetical protein
MSKPIKTAKIMRASITSATQSNRTSAARSLQPINSTPEITPSCKRMKRILTLFVACLACVTARVDAAISVGPTGAGPLTFDTTPAVEDFATAVLQGTATTFSDVATMDAGVAALDAAAIPGLKVLATSGTEPPSTFSGGFRRHTIRNVLMSRPTTDGTNAASMLLATLQNNSGMDRPSIVISYDFAVQSLLTPDELPGYYVYYSLSGAPGSWQPISTLTGTDLVGNHSGVLNLGSWPVGSLLYLIWADDNANGISDPSYTIDNFLVSFGIDPPVITQQPVSISVTQAQTIRLSVVASGIGPQYQWHGPLGPIDPAVNPSAATPNLVIPNAALTDAGSYHVTVNNGGGGVSSDTVTVTVHNDVLPPSLMKLEFVVGNLNGFRLIVNEALCLDPGVCLAFSADTFNWQIQDTATFTDLGVNGVTITGTNVDITTDIARTPGVTYRVVVVQGPPDGGVADLFGNFVPFGASVTNLPNVSFQQGVDGYTGTQDAELHSVAGAATPLGAATTVSIDNDDAGVAQGVLRFDNIFGSGTGQVPLGSEILSAKLTLTQTDPGSSANFYRMLVPWDQSTVTWDSLVEGVTNDGVEMAIASDALSFNEQANAIPHVLDITATVQAWSAGQPNYGWGIRSTGTGGWDWNTGESGATTAPLLVIEYREVACTTAPSFTSQPPATTGTEGGSVTISAGVMTCGETTYQWTKNNVNVNGQTSATLSLVNLALTDAGQYRLRVTNPNGTTTSDPATLTVSADTVRPVVTRVVSPNATTIAVTFSKVMGASASVVAGHYILSPSGSVTGASLSADGHTVTLTTTARNFTTAYSLRIQDVADNRTTPNLISPNPTIVSPTTVQNVIAWNDATAWSYATNSQDATLTTATPWFSPAFVPGAEWLTGAGLFGFDDTPATLAALPAPIVTALTPNNVAAEPNLFVTAYFRRSINLPALPAGGQYVLLAVIDDGAIFYLDGVPVLTNNMPAAGPYEFITRASGAAAEGVVQVFPFNVASGSHTLAVEVHQAGATTSSDVVFGIDIRILASAGPALSITSAAGSANISWSADSSWELAGAANVVGGYGAQAGATATPFSFTLPTTATNHFYRLRYTGRP